MQSTTVLPTHTCDTIRHEVANLLTSVQKLIEHGKAPSGELAAVQVLLESLPLSTGEYGIAKNRLHNAHRYLQSQERGAARFELKLLAGSLRNGGTG